MRAAIIGIVLMLFSAAIASAQPAPGRPAAEGGPTLAGPGAGYVVSLTFADPTRRMFAEEIMSVMLYLAPDPALRKTPEAGNWVEVAPNTQVIVSNVGEDQAGITFNLSAFEAEKKPLVAAAAKRIADALSAPKPPNEQQEKRLHDID